MGLKKNSFETFLTVPVFSVDWCHEFFACMSQIILVFFQMNGVIIHSVLFLTLTNFLKTGMCC